MLKKTIHAAQKFFFPAIRFLMFPFLILLTRKTLRSTLLPRSFSLICLFL